ncbi:hypothetical protein GQ55_9G306700 [Panicum hallii var. hallii]|uniref:Uncharacterized protein n=1 Tax=Panicum hallii var. hallii TaxID=1504633 RepID=A0A2T7C7X0_9POAL|nr:hypothetical protein GQ55_9G306700 [Panicum hallii var. hallii]
MIISPSNQARSTKISSPPFPVKISSTARERNHPYSGASFCVRCWRRQVLGA